MTADDQLAYWKRRARDAERRLESEARFTANTTAWAHRAFDEQRRLGDRCTYLYGVARALGATHEELA